MFAAVALATAATQTAESAHGLGFHWSRAGNPLVLPVIDSVTSAWDAPLTGALTDWSAAGEIILDTLAGPLSPRARKRCAPSIGYVHVCNATYGRTNWLGVAIIWVYLKDTSHIKKARVLVNDTYMESAPSDVKRSLTCQELGHALGLDHQYADSCMNDDPYAPGFLSPDEHDYDDLTSIYTHLDPSASSSQANLRSSANTRVKRKGEYLKVKWITPAP